MTPIDFQRRWIWSKLAALPSSFTHPEIPESHLEFLKSPGLPERTTLVTSFEDLRTGQLERFHQHPLSDDSGIFIIGKPAYPELVQQYILLDSAGRVFSSTVMTGNYYSNDYCNASIEKFAECLLLLTEQYDYLATGQLSAWSQQTRIGEFDYDAHGEKYSQGLAELGDRIRSQIYEIDPTCAEDLGILQFWDFQIKDREMETGVGGWSGVDLYDIDTYSYDG